MVIAIFHSNSLVQVIQFFQLWEWCFPACGSNCLLLVLLLKWNRSHLDKDHLQSAYTSAVMRLVLKWNGCDCDGSLHYAIGFYCCHVTTFWNLIGTANFQAAEVTVWTCGSFQAISPGNGNEAIPDPNQPQYHYPGYVKAWPNVAWLVKI